MLLGKEILNNGCQDPLTCSTNCACNLGSSFWSTRCRSFYTWRCFRACKYCNFRCLSMVVYYWFTNKSRIIYMDLYFLSILSGLFLFAGWFICNQTFNLLLSWFKNAESRLNHHLSGLFGVSSLAWTGHLVHVAIPESRGQHVGWDNFLTTATTSTRINSFFYWELGSLRSKPRYIEIICLVHQKVLVLLF